MNATDASLAIVSLEHILAQSRLWGFDLELIESELIPLINGVRNVMFQMKLKLDKQTDLSAKLIQEVKRQKTFSSTQSDYFRNQLAEVTQQLSGLSMSQKVSLSEKDSMIKSREDKAERYKQEILLAINSLAYGLDEAKSAGYMPAKPKHRSLMDYITELKFGFAQQMKINCDLNYSLKVSQQNQHKEKTVSNDYSSKFLELSRRVDQLAEHPPNDVPGKLKEIQTGLVRIAKEASGCKKFCEFTVRVMYGFILQLRKLKNLTGITSQKLSEFIKQKHEESLNTSNRKLKGAVYAIMACLRLSKLEGSTKEKIIVGDQEILLPSYEISFKVGDWGANPMLVLSKMLEEIEKSQRNIGSALSDYSYKSSLEFDGKESMRSLLDVKSICDLLVRDSSVSPILRHRSSAASSQISRNRSPSSLQTRLKLEEKGHNAFPSKSGTRTHSSINSKPGSRPQSTLSKTVKFPHKHSDVDLSYELACVTAELEQHRLIKHI